MIYLLVESKSDAASSVRVAFEELIFNFNDDDARRCRE
jgi:hypothetical protein